MDLNYVQSNEQYFEELLRRIRAIRASEKRTYNEIKEIFATCSYDYDSSLEKTRNFFAQSQEKLHWAITGCTASDIIIKRADRTKENMGLTTWKNAPDGNIIMRDVTVAKNYYTLDEMDHLHAIVNMFLDYAKRQAELHNIMYMDDWTKKMDEFLKFNEYEIFDGSRKTLRILANLRARNEFEKFKRMNY